ncbi:MAG: type I restriction enzyme HsdR N-terminal domain-containing protein [Flavobacteriaceae bacterium]|nr:type I restriction enzyme HsdR N-terminal domain-containing protein [Flavobacteriaceae bacterium]
MTALNLPKADLRIKNSENKQFIFDIIRKKYVVLTPEEWVRQHIVHFLITHKKYPISLIAVERQLTINNLKKRFDILIFNSKGVPEIIIECKSPRVKITQESFDQIARYNLSLDANLLMVSNGLEHFFCKLDHHHQKYLFLASLPDYQ